MRRFVDPLPIYQTTMKTIYKYPIQIDREQQILMLEGAEIIRVGLDPRGVPCVWAEVEITNDPEKWEVAIVGTGQTLPDGKHLGSFLYGEFVWHVYRMNDERTRGANKD